MTDKQIADQVYIEPLTLESLKEIIIKEKPDSILPTLGGQAGLNLGMELAECGFLDEQGVKLIGTTAETIFKAEDRQAFKDTMEKIGEPMRGFTGCKEYRGRYRIYQQDWLPCSSSSCIYTRRLRRWNCSR